MSKKAILKIEIMDSDLMYHILFVEAEIGNGFHKILSSGDYETRSVSLFSPERADALIRELEEGEE